MPNSILDAGELYCVSKESIFLPHFHYRAAASDGQNNLLIFHQELVELRLIHVLITLCVKLPTLSCAVVLLIN